MPGGSRKPALATRRESDTVTMKHPFFERQVCAKLTWKHPGGAKSKVSLKGPIKGCKEHHHRNLDLPAQQHTITRTAPQTTVTRAVMAHDMVVEPEIETVTVYQ